MRRAKEREVEGEVIKIIHSCWKMVLYFADVRAIMSTLHIDTEALHPAWVKSADLVQGEFDFI